MHKINITSNEGQNYLIVFLKDTEKKNLQSLIDGSVLKPRKVYLIEDDIDEDDFCFLFEFAKNETFVDDPEFQSDPQADNRNFKTVKKLLDSLLLMQIKNIEYFSKHVLEINLKIIEPISKLANLLIEILPCLKKYEEGMSPYFDLGPGQRNGNWLNVKIDIKGWLEEAKRISGSYEKTMFYKPISDYFKKTEDLWTTFNALPHEKKINEISCYQLMMAEKKANCNETQASLLFLHRSIENYLVSIGLKKNLVQIYDDGLRMKSGDRISILGLEKLFTGYRVYLADKKRWALFEEINRYRNQSMLTHGTYSIGIDKLKYFINETKITISRLEGINRWQLNSKKYNIFIDVSLREILKRSELLTSSVKEITGEIAFNSSN